MEKNFSELVSIIQGRSKFPMFAWEARLVAQRLIKSKILVDPKINATIDDMISEKNFPELQLRKLRNEIKESRKPGAIKTLKVQVA